MDHGADIVRPGRTGFSLQAGDRGIGQVPERPNGGKERRSFLSYSAFFGGPGTVR